MRSWLLGISPEKSRQRSLLAILLLMFASMASFAQGFDDRYVAAVGDFNQDGLQDIYLRQKPRIVPIALDDLSIPIPLPAPVEPFVLQRVYQLEGVNRFLYSLGTVAINNNGN